MLTLVLTLTCKYIASATMQQHHKNSVFADKTFAHSRKVTYYLKKKKSFNEYENGTLVEWQ